MLLRQNSKSNDDNSEGNDVVRSAEYGEEEWAILNNELTNLLKRILLKPRLKKGKQERNCAGILSLLSLTNKGEEKKRTKRKRESMKVCLELR